MSDYNYYERLVDDLAEQFKERQKTDGLVRTIAKQLQDVWQFLNDLGTKRVIDTAFGKQLDVIGESVGITRDEARRMAAGAGSVFESEDEMYRAYIKYKMSLNSSTGTYSDIMSSISVQWGGTVKYGEDVNSPARIFLEVERFKGQDIAALANIPIAKPAGVGLTFRTVTKEATTTYFGISMMQKRVLAFSGIDGRIPSEQG